VFAEPERLDLTRNQDANLTFAPGTHHCIGHLFAKMQLTEFFPEFLRRYRDFDVLDDEIKFGGGLTFRGPQALHLRLHRR
jgi:cytochrome P450